MGKYKVSVIVPAYNAENYLKECIESLVNQSLREIQIILVNDASTDNTLSVMKEYQSRYPEKIVVVDLPINQRQGGARNEGFKFVQADWIGYVDSDDFVDKTMFEKLHTVATQTNADNVICVHNIVAEDGTVLGSESVADRTIGLHDCELTDDDREYLIGAYLGGGIWNRLWKKETIIKANLSFPVKKRFEDNYFMSCIVPYLSKIAFVNEPLYFYRRRHDSTIMARNVPQYYDKIEMEELIQDVYEQNGLKEKYKTGLEYLFIRRYFLNSYYFFTSRFDKVDWKIIKHIKKSLKVRFPNWKKNKYFLADVMKRQILTMYRFPKANYYFWTIAVKLKKLLTLHK